MDPKEQHVQAHAEAAAIAAVSLPPEPASATLGVVSNPSGPVLAAAPPTAAVRGGWEEGDGRASGASSERVSQEQVGTVAGPSIPNSPKDGMLEGSAVCCRDGGPNAVAVAAGLGGRDMGGVGSLQLAGAAVIPSKRGDAVNSSMTFAVKPEPSVYALADVLRIQVQLGKGKAPLLPVTARGSAATTAAPFSLFPTSPLPPAAATTAAPAGTAAATPFAEPLAANIDADAAPTVASARATLARTIASAGAAPFAASAVTPATTVAGEAAALKAEPEPPATAAEAEQAPADTAEAATEPPAAAQAALEPLAAAEAAPRPAGQTAACGALCGIELQASKPGSQGAGFKRQLQLYHAVLTKAVKEESSLQEGLQAVQLPAAQAAAIAAEGLPTKRAAAAGGGSASKGMKRRKGGGAPHMPGAGSSPCGKQHGGIECQGDRRVLSTKSSGGVAAAAGVGSAAGMGAKPSGHGSDLPVTPTTTGAAAAREEEHLGQGGNDGKGPVSVGRSAGAERVGNGELVVVETGHVLTAATKPADGVPQKGVAGEMDRVQIKAAAAAHTNTAAALPLPVAQAANGPGPRAVVGPEMSFGPGVLVRGPQTAEARAADMVDGKGGSGGPRGVGRATFVAAMVKPEPFADILAPAAASLGMQESVGEGSLTAAAGAAAQLLLGTATSVPA